MVGVCRPTFDRVKQNIEANINYFLTTYPQHTFAFILLTYINSSYNDLSNYCSEKGIEAHFIPHLEESDFKFKVKNPNWYRAFYSMSYILNKIPENTYDCIIRLRLDSEVKAFELYDTIDPTRYYIVNENERVQTNIGYASHNLMKRVWKTENALIKGTNEEEKMFRIIKSNNYFVKHFKFHFILHQSSDSIFDGVKQWSKRSREWIFDGKDYINRDIPPSAEVLNAQP
jgi:hypothetical protein